MIHRLTRRQNEVLRWLLRGCSNKEIARELEISARTVEMHRSDIYDRMGITSRTLLALAKKVLADHPHLPCPCCERPAEANQLERPFSERRDFFEGKEPSCRP